MLLRVVGGSVNWYNLESNGAIYVKGFKNVYVFCK